MPENTKPFAVVGYFDTPADLYHACEALRDAGVKQLDAHTPFPVHGLEKAMGLPASKLPWLVLGAGLTGLASAFLMQWWMGGIDYPINISGKPPFAAASSVPVGFELTVLFSAFGTFFGMWAMNGLPRFHHPVMEHPSFGAATDDKFFVSVEAADPKYGEAKALLAKLGAHEVAEVSS